MKGGQSPILKVTNLEKRLQNTDLLQKPRNKTLWRIAELTVVEPGLYVLAGRNGAGKSTLLRCLLGLLKPHQGEVHWFGGPSVSAHLIGYMPEFPTLPPSAKVKHWLSWLLGIRVGQLGQYAMRLNRYPSLAVSEFLDVPAHRLSKGQTQRVQLWAALARDPQGLVLDEPFSGLDPWARSELSALLETILSEGKFVILSTHEITKALRALCRETWLLQDAALVVKPGCGLPE